MAKTPATFTAISLEGKKHQVPGVERMNTHRIRRDSWAVTKPASSAGTKRGKAQKASTKSKRGTKTKDQSTPPRSVTTLLRAAEGEWECKYCGDQGDGPECGIACYRAFKHENYIDDKKVIELRGPGPLGYGAFLREDAEPIKKDDYIGEYIGELAPLGANTPYTYEIPDACSIDSQKAGNWTRFMNSHCNPNVNAWGETVGKRHLILLQANKDILPGEELRSCYGRFYFEALKIRCKCDARRREHMPRAERAARGRGRGGGRGRGRARK